MRPPAPTLWSKLPWRPALARQWRKPSRSWAIPSVAAGATLLTLGAVTTSSLVLIDQRSHHRDAMQEVDVLGYVKAFMAGFTTLDPFHANDYADAVLARTTGQMAQDYRARMNEIVVQVARAEPTQGQVLDAGIERWNDDGSASVVIATQTTTTMPDGRSTHDGDRWIVSVVEEGGQWKISKLLQVI